MTYRGIDTIAKVSYENAKKLKELGFSFVCRYIVPETGKLKIKALTLDESNDIRNAGLCIMPIWETTGNRAKSGSSGGTADGIAAAKRARELGIPSGTVIAFAVDYNPPKSDYSDIAAYLRAAAWNIEGYKLGMYAPSAVIKELGSICEFRWCAFAWYTGKADAECYQTHYQDNSAAKTVQSKVGFAVDLDEAKSIEMMWRPNTEKEDALNWAKDFTDDIQIALALWRYHNTYGT